MKSFMTIISASIVLSTFMVAEAADSGVQTTQQSMQQERERTQNEIRNTFHNMNTDQLLEKRGTMTNQREREELHNELQSRYQTMTQEQKQKFMNRPENTPKKMFNGGGMGGGGMGGGKGGR